MKTINIWGIFLITLFVSCDINIDAKLAFLKTKIEEVNQATTTQIGSDSASHVNSILQVSHIEKENIDSIKSVLKSFMEKKYIYVEFKKYNKADSKKYHKQYNEDSLQVLLYCNDKPISFFFLFKDKQLYISSFEGVKNLLYKIDYISISSIPNSPSVYYSFGFITDEFGSTNKKEFLWGQTLFSISLNKNLPTWKLYTCGTPADEFNLYNYTTEEYINLFEKINIGCDSTLLPYVGD